MPENNMQKNDTDAFFDIYAHVVSTLLTTISSQNSVCDITKELFVLKQGLSSTQFPFTSLSSSCQNFLKMHSRGIPV